MAENWTKKPLNGCEYMVRYNTLLLTCGVLGVKTPRFDGVDVSQLSCVD